MKRIHLALAPLIVLLSSSTTFAVKNGIVNMQKVILSVDQGLEARAELEKKIKSKEGEIRSGREKLDKLNKEWQKKAPLLSEDARLKKQQEFQEKFIELRNSEMSFQNEIKREEAKATQKIAMNVQEIVDKLAKKQDLDAVFEPSSSGLIYLKNPVDLTNEVIKQYNVAYPGSKKMNISKKEDGKTSLK